MKTNAPHSDLSCIDQALELAAQALFLSPTHPRVGCILVNPSQQIIGRGFSQRDSGVPAEILALRDAAQQGHDTNLATVYTTFEPSPEWACCCSALVNAKISKIVASVADPDPQISGSGFGCLRAAGIEVIVGPGAEISRELNIGLFSRVTRGIPWVRLKTAASLDGTSALNNGASQWITSAAARADGHAWRARASAILTGVGTVLSDNPRLDVREVPTTRQPHLVVVDSQLQTPPEANLLQIQRDYYIYTAIIDGAKQRALEDRGAQVICLPNGQGKVDLRAMLLDLGTRGINELHVEAGYRLNGSLVREGLVDEMLVYLAPRLLGTGLGMAHLGPLSALTDGVELDFKSIDLVGPDLRIIARVRGRDQF